MQFLYFIFSHHLYLSHCICSTCMYYSANSDFKLYLCSTKTREVLGNPPRCPRDFLTPERSSPPSVLSYCLCSTYMHAFLNAVSQWSWNLVEIYFMSSNLRRILEIYQILVVLSLGSQKLQNKWPKSGPDADKQSIKQPKMWQNAQDKGKWSIARLSLQLPLAE